MLLLVLNSTFPFLPKGCHFDKGSFDKGSVGESSAYEGLSIVFYVSDEKDVSYNCILVDKNVYIVCLLGAE